MLGGLSGAGVVGAAADVGGVVVGGAVVTCGVVVGGTVSCGLSEIHRENIIKNIINAHIFIDDTKMK